MRPACARCARAGAARHLSASETRPSRAFVPPRTRPAIRSASSNTNPKLGPQRPSSSALLRVAHLAHDLGLADARRVEPAAVEQMLGGAFLCHARKRRSASPCAARAPSRAANASRRKSCTGVRSLRAKARHDCRLRGMRARRAACAAQTPAAAPPRAPAAARTPRALRSRPGAMTRRRGRDVRASFDPWGVP